jgi:hypothetical protein
MYIKSLRSALVVMAVFLAVSIVAIVALASRAGVVSPLSTASPQGKSLPYSTFGNKTEMSHWRNPA